MSVRLKVTMSYLLISIILLVVSVGFVIALKKLNNVVNNDITELIESRVQINQVNKEFIQTVVNLKTLLNVEEQEEVNELKKDFESKLKFIDNMVDKKLKVSENCAGPINKIKKLKADLKKQAERLYSLKSEDIALEAKIDQIGTDMDSLYRQNKGLIIVVKNQLDKNRYRDEISLLDKAFEDALEVKIYTNQMLAARDLYDIEDAYISLESYTNALLAKVDALLTGKNYHGTDVRRITQETPKSLLEKIQDRKKVVETLKPFRDFAVVISLEDDNLNALLDAVDEAEKGNAAPLKKILPPMLKNLENYQQQ